MKLNTTYVELIQKTIMPTSTPRNRRWRTVAPVRCSAGDRYVCVAAAAPDNVPKPKLSAKRDVSTRA